MLVHLVRGGNISGIPAYMLELGTQLAVLYNISVLFSTHLAFLKETQLPLTTADIPRQPLLYTPPKRTLILRYRSSRHYIQTSLQPHTGGFAFLGLKTQP
ncbi:hypothetical protein MN608_05050 [Microdochium nivale]|nr:hypothetical protein MN608_05050 [Microdochium nivale]